MKTLFLSFAILALESCSPQMAFASHEGGSVCMVHGKLLEFAKKSWDEVPIAQASVHGNEPEEFLLTIIANPQGKFDIVITTKKGEACVIASGEKFTIIEDKGI